MFVHSAHYPSDYPYIESCARTARIISKAALARPVSHAQQPGILCKIPMQIMCITYVEFKPNKWNTYSV